MNVFKKSLKVSLKSFPSAAVWNELFMCISLRFGNTLISGTSAEAVSCVPGGPLDRCVVVVPIIYQGTGGDVLTPNLNNVISHVQCWAVCRALRHNHAADKRHDGDRVLEEQHLENSVWETKSQSHQKFRSHSTWGWHVRDGLSHPKQMLQSETWCQAVQQLGIGSVCSLVDGNTFFIPSRWKFTFYLYIFTYGVRFLKKVSFAQIQMDSCLSDVTVTIPSQLQPLTFVGHFRRGAERAWKSCGQSWDAKTMWTFVLSRARLIREMYCNRKDREVH